MGRAIIIGGGIAGVSTARALARRGVEVVLLEREPQLGQHATGLNAAIFRLAVAEPVNVALALRSRAIGDELVAGGTVWPWGGLYPCEDAAEREAILEASACAGVRPAVASDVPRVLMHRERPGLFSPDDGVIDVHALLQALASDAVRHGARLRRGVTVEQVVTQSGRATGVVVDGEELPADFVIDATGAWSPWLSGAPTLEGIIRPHRRHLFMLDTEAASAFSGVVWDLTDGVYLRPESGGLLVSACDETPLSPGMSPVPIDRELPGVLFDKLSRWAPELSVARVRRYWACLRPLTPDHRFVVGEDPRLAGLVRVGGFGGHGMTAGAAAGELAAALVCGGWPRWASELAPARFSEVRPDACA